MNDNITSYNKSLHLWQSRFDTKFVTCLIFLWVMKTPASGSEFFVLYYCIRLLCWLSRRKLLSGNWAILMPFLQSQRGGAAYFFRNVGVNIQTHTAWKLRPTREEVWFSRASVSSQLPTGRPRYMGFGSYKKGTKFTYRYVISQDFVPQLIYLCKILTSPFVNINWLYIGNGRLYPRE
jgi:hypothetical protein